MKPKHRQPTCKNCGRVIDRGMNCFGYETDGVAYVNTKIVCQLCFIRLKHQSKTRGRPLTNRVWERWMRIGEAK